MNKTNCFFHTSYSWYALVLIFIGILSCKPNKPETTEGEAIDTRQFLYGICIDSLDVTNYTIAQGDNFSFIFEKLGFSSSMSDSIYRSVENLVDAKKIRAGLSYLTLTTQDTTASIRYVVFEKSITDHVIIDFTGQQIHSYLYQKEVTLKQRYLEGAVSSSLWNEFKRQGVDPMLAIQISDIFAWEIDFFSIQENDSFRILFTEAFIEDTVKFNITSIDGAIFTHDGTPYAAIPFEQDSIREFFNAEGQSLRKAFLKAPLDYFRISSHFTNSRFHPVLKRYRAHHGVDYAAPSGTPVKTIGNGKVIAKGYQRGGGGNFIKIQHNSTYTTIYMHLKGFAKGIQIGKQVRQGEVIGYVGSTGLSTGPHLDFRVYQNGKPINPLKMESPPSYPVQPEQMDSFLLIKKEILLQMEYYKKKDTIAYKESNEELSLPTN